MNAFKIVGTYGTMYYVNSMEAAVAWHSKALGGLKPSFESPDWTEFPLPGGHSLCLHGLMPGQKNPQIGVLIIKVKNLDALIPHLNSLNVEIVTPKNEVHPGAYCLDVLDDSKNRMSFYENTNEA